MTWDFPSGYFDCIVSIATLHHLPLREIIPVIKDALKPGGLLIILDLRRDESISDSLWSLAAVPVNILLRLLKYRRFSEPAELRRAWDEHGKNETYISMGEARGICSDLLVGAKLRRHLLWRYSIIWEKPGPQDTGHHL
jgi:SAM-dependent methyltransferase